MKSRTILMVSSALAALMATASARAQDQAQTSAAPSPQEQPPGTAQPTRSDDIIVTAQRREQTLLEVPQSISVLGGDTLERQQATSFADYAQLVPGLNITQENPGETRLILRGINTGSVGSTVAVYVDDIPFGSSSSFSNGGIQAGDFDTFDIQRVEVLRGPQGTLYGSNSLGGVLKFITTEPSTERFEARGQAGVEDTQDGGTGYSGNAVINVPLGDQLAVRASGFYRNYAGFIDATGRTGRNINGAESYGGRASLLFKPTDDLSIRLSGVIQNIDVDSPSAFEVDPVTLRPVDAITGIRQGKNRTRYERYPESNTVRYRLYNGTANWNMGFATLTSVSSYAEQSLLQINDISTNAVTGLANGLYAPTAPNSVGLIYQNDLGLKKYTQEVRLASADSDVFEWLIGGYYTHEKSRLFQRYQPFTLASQALIPTRLTLGGATFDEFVVASIDAKYEEYAGFASGTFHLGPRFDITAGGRYSHNKQSSVQSVVQLGTGDPTTGGSSEGVFTWSVAPRFELSDNVSLYARVAKGYRPGGPNFIPLGAPAGFPAEFEADTLVNYEVGLRGETADRSFGFDLSGFYIDWDNILISSTADSAAGPVGVNANGQRARSYGAEATATARPTRGFTVVGTLAYTKAYLRDDTVPSGGGLNLVGGLAGDPLPYVPRWSAGMSADYEWTLGGDAKAFVGANVHLTGDQAAAFNAEYRATYGRRLVIDGYNTVDLRAGVDLGAFSITAFAKNVTDTYGLVSADGTSIPVPPSLGGSNVPVIRATSIRPRTVGVTLGAAF